MARTAKLPPLQPGQAGFFEEPDGLEARQSGESEIVDAERDKMEQIMSDIAGAASGEFVFWLHRASEKNRALHGMFLKRYPSDTKIIDIVEEARDTFGGGDFVLVVKKDDLMFRKASFSTEKVVPVAPAKEPPPTDPFTALAASMEKALVMDRGIQMLGSRKEGAGPEKAGNGIDSVITMMMTMMTGMQNQNTELLKIMMTQRNEPKGGDNDSLLEAIKLGSALAGGKLPIEEGEGGIGEILKSLTPILPQIIQGLMGKGGPRPAPVTRPATSHPVPGVPVPGVVTEPVPPEVLAAHTVAADPAMIVRQRIVDEVKFVLALPPSPKLYEHVISYIDAYAPDILQQAEIAPEEVFVSYIVGIDPAFVGHEDFFRNLHRMYMAGATGDEEPDAVEEKVIAAS